MSKHLERDIAALEQELLSMSAIVEEMIDQAWRSLVDRSTELAQAVIDRDEIVNKKEVRIEEECLKILALHQPVAIDLRRTATIIKINNDLERIADLAVNIAERGQRLTSEHRFQLPNLVNTMAEQATRMLSDALDAMVKSDYNAAVRVCSADDEVDQALAAVVSELYETMRADNESIGPAIHALSVARSLERIADLATNIAEDVMYLIKGDITRHRHKVFVSFADE
ncbi:MAG: phosphate signaling complex protein PhoU [Planctomycetales bacterium]|nr:phosphate signaling complex protein PhoU [Planctomycetales bacterium]